MLSIFRSACCFYTPAEETTCDFTSILPTSQECSLDDIEIELKSFDQDHVEEKSNWPPKPSLSQVILQKKYFWDEWIESKLGSPITSIPKVEISQKNIKRLKRKLLKYFK